MVYFFLFLSFPFSASPPLLPFLLGPENVISVLISSEFLKMAALVEMCLEFLHVNLSAVLSTKCNVSSIPDHLVVRLAHKFTPMELETIQDRRDKFRK